MIYNRALWSARLPCTSSDCEQLARYLPTSRVEGSTNVFSLSIIPKDWHHKSSVGRLVVVRLAKWRVDS